MENSYSAQLSALKFLSC